MKRIITIILLTFMLGGCSIFKPKPDIKVEAPPVIHPALPAPVQLDFDPKLKLKLSDDKLKAEMSFEDMLSLIKFNSNIENYIANMKLLLCYYRTELKEDFCESNSE